MGKAEGGRRKDERFNPSTLQRFNDSRSTIHVAPSLVKPALKYDRRISLPSSVSVRLPLCARTLPQLNSCNRE